MSILLAIGKSHKGRHIRSLRAASARELRKGPIVGEWDGSEAASVASDKSPGERRMNAAVGMCWDFDLRLEHEIQTAMGRQRWARPQFRSIAHGMARHSSKSFAAPGTRIAREVSAVCSKGHRGVGAMSDGETFPPHI